eukprot:CAMPEP_0184682996 /NCGR_PEP_ID=MMETSP0312-20130426/9523_1 /TAXON_ID=31354 /ORGANISM="Compsopogon coeruleus, Strain SAG 36.94" /LENGTH=318 /DNA_ID=CAMNT_0027135017 /DNA_START=139 /DNA_END=1091 /DNA_ORIENTATION=-
MMGWVSIVLTLLVVILVRRLLLRSRWDVVEVTQLVYYPVKSCRGVEVDCLEIGARGFVHDRMVMMVDEEGHFVSQRKVPRMSLIEAGLDMPGAEWLTMRFVGDDSIPVGGDEEVRVYLGDEDLNGCSRPLRIVTVWNDTCQAIDLGDEVASWLERVLGFPGARLVKFPSAGRRPVDARKRFLREQHSYETGFADAFPFLLASEESLQELNQELPNGTAVGMNRFRPNVVVRSNGTSLSWAEDDWTRAWCIRDPAVAFRFCAPCERCRMPRVDPQTGSVHPVEPSRTLARIREAQFNGQVMFGQYVVAIPTARGHLLRV